VVLLVVAFVWAAPVLGLLVTSFRTSTDVAATGWWTSFLHPRFTLANYSAANDLLNFPEALKLSLGIALPATVGTVAISSVGAYALARMEFPGRKVLLFLVVGMLVVPPQLTLVPLLRLFSDVGLTGNLAAVSLYQIGFTVPYGIFLIYGFFHQLPNELIEAARIDGASDLQIFLRIALPTALPVLASLAMLQFLWSWNDLLIPLIFLDSGSGSAPFTVQVAGLVQTTGQGQEVMAAGALMSAVVPVAVLLFLQRFFVRGILSGSVKG
jgi:alpha-glucoside transport system permease protein